MDDTLYTFLGLIIIAAIVLSLAYLIWYIGTLNSIKNDLKEIKLQMKNNENKHDKE